MIVPGNVRPCNYMEIMYGLYGERTYFLGALEVILIYNLTKPFPPLPVREEIVWWVSKTSHELQRGGSEMSPALLLPKVNPPLSTPLISEKTYSSPLHHQSISAPAFPPVKTTLCHNGPLCPSCSNSKAKPNCRVNFPRRIGGDDQKWPPTRVATARLANDSKPDLGILMKWPQFPPQLPPK